MTEDEIVGWHHQLNGREFEQASGDGKEQGSLACCSPWGHKESDTTERLNNNFLSYFSVPAEIQILPIFSKFSFISSSVIPRNTLNIYVFIYI